MDNFLWTLITYVSNLHYQIMNINNVNGYNYTDKQLHFIVVGIVGGVMLLILHPIFSLLAKHGMTIVITFLYVFTVLVGLTFAIEIGQGLTGTGYMEFEDITSGLSGFMLVFVFYAAAVGILALFKRVGKGSHDRR